MSFVAQDMSVAALLERVDSREYRLPEIQRDYVWKSSQIAWLLDSLYRGYPSGGILVWESDKPVEEKDVNSSLAGTAKVAPKYLLDGQQRLTSLHRAFNGHPDAKVVFNIVTEKFQLESAATKKDPRWLPVRPLLHGAFKAANRKALLAAVPGLDEDEIDERVARIGRIKDYKYRVEVLQHMTYAEVTDIFVRVNSRGKSLTRGDLALATLTANYPGFYEKIRSRAEQNAQLGYGQLGISTLTRALALFGTSGGSLSGLASASNTEIDTGWAIVTQGTTHLLQLLKQNLDLGTDTLLPSVNALIPLIGFLGTRDTKTPLSQQDASALLYWLLVASLTSRYTGPVDTLLAQDKRAIATNSIAGLYANLGLTGRYQLTESYLVGKSLTSAAFLLSFLTARANGATDWWTATKIGLDGSGQFRIEYHHIHPQATLKTKYTKAQVFDLANLAFISEAANKRISSRTPEKYFPDLDDAELQRHLIPLDSQLRTPDHYLEFVTARRGLLATAINDYLDKWAPEFLTASAGAEPPAPRVSLQLVADQEPENGVLVITCETAFGSGAGSLPVRSLLLALMDAENGIAAQVDLASGESLPVEVVDDGIAIDFGPTRLEGAIDEWREVLDREVAEAVPSEGQNIPAGWPEPAAEPVPFAIRESD